LATEIVQTLQGSEKYAVVIGNSENSTISKPASNTPLPLATNDNEPPLKAMSSSARSSLSCFQVHQMSTQTARAQYKHLRQRWTSSLLKHDRGDFYSAIFPSAMRGSGCIVD